MNPELEQLEQQIDGFLAQGGRPMVLRLPQAWSEEQQSQFRSILQETLDHGNAVLLLEVSREWSGQRVDEYSAICTRLRGWEEEALHRMWKRVCGEPKGLPWWRRLLRRIAG